MLCFINEFLFTTYKVLSFETTCSRSGIAKFIYCAFRPFTEHCKRIQKFKETVNSRYIYCNKLDKACFSQGAVYAYLRQRFER